MSLHLNSKWPLAILAIICAALAAMSGRAHIGENKTRELEIEWRIPVTSLEQVPTEVGIVSLGDSIECGPTDERNTKRDDKYLVLSRSSLVAPGVEAIYPYVMFRNKMPRLAAWTTEIPRQGLTEKWSEWRRAKFIDNSESPDFKLLNGKRGSRQAPPKDFAIEMRFKIPSYFKID